MIFSDHQYDRSTSCTCRLNPALNYKIIDIKPYRDLNPGAYSD
ncbi:MAG: hypothetical protein ACI955_002564 [Zhongshania sp.]|jgi:hypothetical protein